VNSGPAETGLEAGDILVTAYTRVVVDMSSGLTTACGGVAARDLDPWAERWRKSWKLAECEAK